MANLLTTLAEITQSLGDFATTRQALAEALTIHTGNGDKLRSAVALCSWADVDRAQGDYGGARRHYLQGMALAHAIWDRRWLAISLEGVAYCSAALTDPMTAVRLWSVAAALRTAITAPLPPAQKPPYEAALAAAKARLGAEPFAAAWEAGQHMSLDEARRTAEEWTPLGEDRGTEDKGDKVIPESPFTPSPPHPFPPHLFTTGARCRRSIGWWGGPRKWRN